LESNLTSSNQFDMSEKSIEWKAVSVAFVTRLGYVCWVKNHLMVRLNISSH